MPPPIEDRRPPITPQLAVRVAVLGGFAFVLFAVIFFRLWFLQVLTGDDYVSQARENRIRKVKIEAPRGNIVDRNGRTLVKTRAAPVVQILPTAIPDEELEVADDYRKALALAEGRRQAAAEDLRALQRVLKADGRRTRRAEKRQVRRLRHQSERADRVPIAPVPAGATELRALYRAARRRDRPRALPDPQARGPGHRRPAVGERDDPDGRPVGGVQLPARAPRGVPGRRGREEVPAPLPVQDARRPALRHPARDLPGRDRDRGLPRREPGHADRQGRDRGELRQATCAAPTASRA